MQRTSIDIHGYVRQIELNKSVVDTLQVCTLSIGAFRYVQIGYQVGQAIGFCRDVSLPHILDRETRIVPITKIVCTSE
jgi:hypothetical protein